jgi:hypothetical protein
MDELTAVDATCPVVSSAHDVALCEDFRTPAVTNVSPRTAAGVRKSPRDETAGRGHVLGGAARSTMGIWP